MQDKLVVIAQAIGEALDGMPVSDFVKKYIAEVINFVGASSTVQMPVETITAKSACDWLNWFKALPVVQVAIEKYGSARPDAHPLLHYLHELAKHQDQDAIANAKKFLQIKLQQVRQGPPRIGEDLQTCVMAFALPATKPNAKPRILMSIQLVKRTGPQWDGFFGPPQQPELTVSKAAFFDSDGQPRGDFDANKIAQISNRPWGPEQTDSWHSFVAEIDQRCIDMFGGPLNEFASKVFGGFSATPVVLLVDKSQIFPSPWATILWGLLTGTIASPVADTALAGTTGGQHSQVRIATSPRHQCLGMMDSRTQDGMGRQKAFPLDATQRLAAMQAMTLRPVAGQCILPVNGPPGTGKTSFLKAVLASHWVNAALAKAPHPPVVFGTAATNKAVINVIDAFSDVPGLDRNSITGRWLDGLPSYGWFYPSAEAAKDHPDFMHLVAPSNNGLVVGGAAKAFAEISPEQHATNYVALGAELLGLATSGQAKTDVPRVIHALHGHMVTQRNAMDQAVKDFKNALATWRAHAAQAHGTAWLLHSAKHHAANLELLARAHASQMNDLHSALQSGRHYLANARPLKTGWRSWLPPGLNQIFFVQALKDLHALEHAGKKAFAKVSKKWTTVWPLLQDTLAQIKSEIDALAQMQGAFETQQRVALARVEQLVKARTLRRQACQATLSMMHPVLKLLPGEASSLRYLVDLCSGNATRAELALDMLWARFDSRQDLTHRVPLFHLAARYWEGRWVQAALNKNESLTDAQRLQRLMMLGVIVVSTTHKLMGLGKLVQAELVVMDEAGQCAPEVAVCALDMGRTALLVGDIRQLQPVTLLTLDKVNQIARQFDIAPTALPGAFNPVGGSGMAVAQYATHLRDSGEDPGITLLYHYRCLPEIIGYCNEMLYGGQMHIVRSTGPTPCRLPAMSWVDVSREEPKKQGSSWVNEGEIEEIIQWIEQSYAGLCTAYGKPLDEILAVITPLAAQAGLAEKNLIQRLGPLVGEDVMKRMIIGTVHRLQGAERPVVAFSLVQRSDNGSNLFADRDGGFLMNVAVSRAKDAFIIFGHRATLKPHARDETGPVSGASTQVAPVSRLGRYLRQHGTRLYPRSLVVVEAPGKVKAVQAALGLGAAVVATKGTLRESQMTPEGRLVWGAPAEDFINAIRVHQGLVDEVVIATDDDLAGEMIGWQVAELAAEHMGYAGGVRRMRFHSTVPDHLQLSFKLAGTNFDTDMLAAALLREYGRHHDKNAFESALPGRSYVSAPRRDLLAIVEQTGAESQRVVYVRAENAAGEQFDGFVPADSSTLAAPMLLTPADADVLAGQLRTSTVTPESMSAIMQIPALYPPGTTLRILAIAADELGIVPWEAQEHLNALYQEGTR